MTCVRIPRAWFDSLLMYRLCVNLNLIHLEIRKLLTRCSLLDLSKSLEGILIHHLHSHPNIPDFAIVWNYLQNENCKGSRVESRPIPEFRKRQPKHTHKNLAIRPNTFLVNLDLDQPVGYATERKRQKREASELNMGEVSPWPYSIFGHKKMNLL